ncbi:uncharacterized protein LOC132179736 [Corylus avellana]|uniref:uncharacterized protein LOC132179736 n=1 Tax=Corylus avellana TaxID=13451 RepID=UPI00286BED86|nr:uncharacterized protein LOC132179736 [Corylus avellana]
MLPGPFEFSQHHQLILLQGNSFVACFAAVGCHLAPAHCLLQLHHFQQATSHLDHAPWSIRIQPTPSADTATRQLICSMLCCSGLPPGCSPQHGATWSPPASSLPPGPCSLVHLNPANPLLSLLPQGSPCSSTASINCTIEAQQVSYHLSKSCRQGRTPLCPL